MEFNNNIFNELKLLKPDISLFQQKSLKIKRLEDQIIPKSKINLHFRDSKKIEIDNDKSKFLRFWEEDFVKTLNKEDKKKYFLKKKLVGVMDPIEENETKIQGLINSIKFTNYFKSYKIINRKKVFYKNSSEKLTHNYNRLKNPNLKFSCGHLKTLLTKSMKEETKMRKKLFVPQLNLHQTEDKSSISDFSSSAAVIFVPRAGKNLQMSMNSQKEVFRTQLNYKNMINQNFPDILMRSETIDKDLKQLSKRGNCRSQKSIFSLKTSL